MALEIESVNPPSAIHLNDGDEKSIMASDLEDGEIEDGEIPDEETVTDKKTSSAPSGNIKQTVVKIKPPVAFPRVKKTVIPVNNNTDIGKENIVEDDWASDVEKAIKAAMDSKAKTSELKTVTSASDTKCQDRSEEDDDKKSRRKKRKRKHRDDDEDRKELKKRKRSHGISKETSENGLDLSQELESNQDVGDDNEDDDYDDEMLFVRGASPIIRMGYSPPSDIFDDVPYGFVEGGHFEDPYDSFCDDSDFEREDYIRPRRGGGNGVKRGGRGVKRRLSGRGGGRGLANRRLQGHRKEVLANKGKRIGMKRQQMRSTIVMPESRQGPDSVCMFFMQGKCQKGDECPYSHDAHPPRKMELCKFYLMDCCAKKDKCLYMHSNFPCKFYHTGLKCFAGDRCKFSHGPLTEISKAILLKHLETAPKEILGDFPRLSREGAAAMVFSKKNRGNKGSRSNKKIPSLFEIEVPIPAQLLSGNQHEHEDEDRSPARRSTPMPDSENEEQDGCRTPMPSPPKMENHDTSCRSSDRQWNARPSDEKPHSSFSRSHHSTESGKECNGEREQSKRSSPDYQNEQSQQPKMKFYQETLSNTEEHGVGSESRHRRHRHRHSKNKTTGDEQERKNKVNLHRLAGYSPSHTGDSDGGGGPSKQSRKSRSGESTQYPLEKRKFEVDDQMNDFQGDFVRPEPFTKAQNHIETDNSSSCNTDMGGIPHTLPKKQRELFLRIQQQQREAADSGNQNPSGENNSKDEDTDQGQDENWYSSDEEEASLTDVLKNLSKQQQQEHSTNLEPRLSTTPPLPAPVITPSLDSIKLAEIEISESVSRLLSSIRNQQNARLTNMPPVTETSESRTSQTAVAVPSQARDPRLVSRDSRNCGSSTSSTPMVSPRSHESPCHDTRSLKRSNSSDERTEIVRTSIYSSVINVSSPNVTQGHLSSANDTDLRRFHAKQLVNSGFETGTDMDLRQNIMNSSYMFGDTDLRTDVDLRVLSLPFKPIPMHTPATEIDASLTSHPPIPYKLVHITIPRPDYSEMKFNMADPQVRSDPRLRRLYRIPSTTGSAASPPPPPPPSRRSSSSVSRTDPRRRCVPVIASVSSPRIQETPLLFPEINPQSHMNVSSGVFPLMPSGIPPDLRFPRNPRNAPGLLGPAPLPHNYCPSTPRYEDV